MKDWLFKILTVLITFFAPIQGILFTMIALVLADTVTGLWKAYKLGKPITSSGLSAIISKLLLYCGSIMLVYSVDINLLNELVTKLFSVETLVTKVIAMIFAFVELISINENYKAVKGCDIWSVFKDLTKRAKVLKDHVDELDLDEFIDNKN